jgi:signal transduction histidine kinase/CheY-like chemotaxis protein
MGSLAIQPNSKRAFALAVALLAAALLLQWSLRPVLGHRLPFLFMFPAIGIAAMWGGWRPACLVLIGGLFSGLAWMEPTGGLSMDGVAGRVAVAGYLVAGGLLMALGGRMSLLRARAVDAENAVAQQLSDVRALQSALEAAAVPFCLLEPRRDETGQVTGFNWTYLNEAAARVLRRPANEAIGRPVREFLGDASLEPGTLPRSLQALREGRTTQFETWVDAGGVRRWFHVIASPSGAGLAVWFNDVTSRKRHEEALREADRRKDEFLATLAHELRNPLAPIRQAALIARSPNATPAQQRWSHEVIERQVAHMARLLDDLLDVSRITRGKLTLRKSVIELRSVVDAALEATRPLAEAKQQVLRAQLPGDPVWLEADPMRLSQVLTNLITNAVKYTPAQGRIDVSARVEAGEVRLAVRDDGLGIPADAIEAVFEMFTQVRAHQEASAGGLGIGLALSRGLVELHGGSLTAESDGAGHGSTFTVCLQCAAAPAAQEDASPSPGRTVRSRRVLVADDNRDAAESLADLLRMDGHEVTVAFDGEQALAAFGRVLPDVALLDIGMPGLTGNEVASAIRARPEGAGTLLVAITGWGQERDRAAARQSGFDHHFTKPVDPMQVLALLGRTT